MGSATAYWQARAFVAVCPLVSAFLQAWADSVAVVDGYVHPEHSAITSRPYVCSTTRGSACKAEDRGDGEENAAGWRNAGSVPRLSVAAKPGCVPGCLQKGRKRRPLRRAACMHVARQREARMATNERMMVSDRERDGGDVSGNLPGNLPQSLPESDPEGDPEGGRPGVPGGVRRGQGQGDREGRRGRGPGVDADRRPEGRGEGGPDRGSEVRSQVRFARAAQSGPGGDPWVGFGDPDSGR